MKWLTKEKNTPLQKAQLDKLRQCGRFHGVKLHRSGCQACSKFAGEVFSFTDVPRLPVKGCDARVCTCEYMGVTDRRQNKGRRLLADRRQKIRMEIDRRFMQDRRLGADKWKGFDR